MCSHLPQQQPQQQQQHQHQTSMSTSSPGRSTTSNGSVKSRTRCHSRRATRIRSSSPWPLSVLLCGFWILATAHRAVALAKDLTTASMLGQDTDLPTLHACEQQTAELSKNCTNALRSMCDPDNMTREEFLNCRAGFVDLIGTLVAQSMLSCQQRAALASVKAEHIHLVSLRSKEPDAVTKYQSPFFNMLLVMGMLQNMTEPPIRHISQPSEIAAILPARAAVARKTIIFVDPLPFGGRAREKLLSSESLAMFKRFVAKKGGTLVTTEDSFPLSNALHADMRRRRPAATADGAVLVKKTRGFRANRTRRVQHANRSLASCAAVRDTFNVLDWYRDNRQPSYWPVARATKAIFRRPGQKGPRIHSLLRLADERKDLSAMACFDLKRGGSVFHFSGSISHTLSTHSDYEVSRGSRPLYDCMRTHHRPEFKQLWKNFARSGIGYESSKPLPELGTLVEHLKLSDREIQRAALAADALQSILLRNSRGSSADSAATQCPDAPHKSARRCRI